MNPTKIKKAIELILNEANELDKEAISSMKDNNIGKVYINIKTMQKAMSMIEKAITADIKKRKEVVVLEAENKIVLENKELKIKKLSKKELKEITESEPVKKVVKKAVVKEPVKAVAKKKAPAKKAVKKTALKKSETKTVVDAPKKKGKKTAKK